MSLIDFKKSSKIVRKQGIKFSLFITKLNAYLLLLRNKAIKKSLNDDFINENQLLIELTVGLKEKT